MEFTTKSDFVNVVARIKPPIGQILTENGIQVISTHPPVIVVPDRQQSFSLDHVFDEKTDQESIYTKTVQCLVDSAMLGYNCTVFAYGQTGSGKTYTMGTDTRSIVYSEDSWGICIRTLKDILTRCDENTEANISISFYEIYNEKVYDLLTDSKSNLTVKSFQILNLTKVNVKYFSEAQMYLKKAGLNRHRGETKQNATSSRSHAILTIYCGIKNENSETTGKLNLVDLAGSESPKLACTEGPQFQEGININKGLFCIGQVISALSTNNNCIPYRDSTITSVLRDSLSKNNFITLIACISPNVLDISDTLQTLDFAQRAKKLKSKPELNLLISEHAKTNPLLLSSKPSRYRTPLHKRPLPFSTSTSLTTLVPNSLFIKNSSNSDHRLIPPCSTFMSESDSVANVSSVSSSASAGPALRLDVTTLSPLIRTCVQAIQSKFMEQLEQTIQTRIEMTPKFTMNDANIQRLIQNEVLKATMSQTRCQSSPKNNIFAEESEDSPISNQYDTFAEHFNTPMRTRRTNLITKFDNTDEISSKSMQNNDLENGNAVFKVPLPPVPMPRKRKLTTLSVGDVSTSKPTPAKRRTSLRLSLKAANVTNTVKGGSCQSCQSGTRRRSGRLMNWAINSPKINSPNNGKTFVKMNKTIKSKRAPKLRSKVEYTPKDRYTHLLHILNYGTESDLMKLPSVGSKTALQLFCYRSIRGKFKHISDIADMPWKGKGYTRFLEANFVDPNLV